jgi:pantetheine-phosphate adenylyltransferase
MNICLFPGTFDPVTLGHIDIILRAKPLFDTIVIGVGRNSLKTPMFSAEQRLQWFEDIFKDEPGITAAIYEGLRVNFAKNCEHKFILRGIRYVRRF